MKRWKKGGIGLLVLILCLLWSTIVYGDDSSIIEKVTVKIDTDFGEPEEIPEPKITVSGTGCSLVDYQFKKDYEDWKPGKKVRLEITVGAEEGKYFPVSLSRSECKVTGAEFVSAKALDESMLQVKVDYYPITVLGTTEKAGWSSGQHRRATWKAVEHAPGYNLVLYGDDKVVKRVTVSNTNVDLSDYMQDVDKTYYYEVKAVPVTKDDKKYFKEGDYVTSTDQELDWTDMDDSGSSGSSSSGGSGSVYSGTVSSSGADGGSLKGSGYVLPDGTRAANTWKKVRDTWYYFDRNGARQTGWLNDAGRWYYFNANGMMQTGWVQDGAHWYFMGPDGDMQIGWVQTGPGRWYYFGADGAMLVNTVIDGWTIGSDGLAYQ